MHVFFIALTLIMRPLPGLQALSPCGRSTCAESKVPFLHDQRCSCSLRCSLFGDCCPDFRATSKGYVRYAMPGQRLNDVTCGFPPSLIRPFIPVKFASDVPPFYRIGSCPDETLVEDTNSSPLGNVFVEAWPIVDIATGIVYDNLKIAKCNSAVFSNTGDRSGSIDKGPLKYWPSFSILCNNETVDRLPENFNPFNANDARHIINDLACQVELTDPKNYVMFPVAYCIPFEQPEKVVQNGCVISAQQKKNEEKCLDGDVSIVLAPKDPDIMKNNEPVFYRNPSCAGCNGFENNQITCNFSVAGWRPVSLLSSSRMVFHRNFGSMNVFRLMVDFTWEPKDLLDVNSLTNQPSSITPVCEDESEIYVPWLKSCHQMRTPNKPELVSVSPPSLQDEKSAMQSSVNSSSLNCFLEITPKSNVTYEVLNNNSLLIETKIFDEGDYTFYENGSIVLRYCVIQTSKLAADNDDNIHLHGENEIPIRDIISRFITLGFMILSIVSLAVMLAIYMLFPQLRNLPGKIIMCLAVTLMAALTGYAIGVLAFQKIWYPLCFSIAVFIHFNFLASFAFCTCLAFDIWRTFHSKSATTPAEQAHGLYVRYSLFSWGLAVCIVAVSITVEFLPEFDWSVMPRPRYSNPVPIIHPADFHTSGYHKHAIWICWMMNRYAVMAYFKVPIGLCLVSNAIFFGLTVYRIRQASEHSAQAGRGRQMRLRRRLFIYLKLSIIMGMTWLFGFIAAATRIEALWIPFGLTNSLQGFYVCLTFICTKKVARLLRGWSAGERRQSIDPRAYASTSARTTLMSKTTSTNTTSLENRQEN